MVVLYLTSSMPRAGKTGVAAGIAKVLRSQNKRVGYLRPNIGVAKDGLDDDASVLQRFLGLQESHEVLAPAFADERAMAAGMKSAIGAVSSQKDVVVVEGPTTSVQGAVDAAAAAEARVVGVENYAADFGPSAAYLKPFGKRLAGVVINRVPLSRTSRISAAAEGKLAGARLLATIPEDRLIMSLSVAELAHDVDGKILSGKERSSTVIESILLGAMNPDHGPEYYSVKPNKAVITRSERPDMQLAALETSTSCIVLAGEQPPIQLVLRRAEAKNVPIVSTKADVKSVLASLESALSGAGLNDRRIAALAELMDKHLDLSGVT